MRNSEKSILSRREFLKALFTVSVPIMIQNFINAFVNTADTVMIGRLGTIEIAAVGLGNQLFFLLNLIMFGTCSGSMVFAAQFWGKQDIKNLRKTFGLCLTICLTISGIFTFFCLLTPNLIIAIYSNDIQVIKTGAEYLRLSSLCFIPFSLSFVFIIMLRAIERVKVPVVTTLISLSINCFLNAVFIFGLFGCPKLGVKGAATATVIARFTEIIIIYTITKKNRYPILGPLSDLFSFNAAFVKNFFLIALPVIINETIWSLGITCQNKIFASVSTAAYAAFNITSTVSYLTWVIFIGISNGAAVLIGKEIGSGNHVRARAYAEGTAILSPAAALIISLFLFPVSFLIPFIFNVEKEVLEIIPYMFAVLSCVYPIKAFNLAMVVGVCRSGGDTKFALIYDVLFMWILSLPLAAFTAASGALPVWLIYMCVFSEEPCKMIFGILRLKSGKWLHSVVEPKR